ncbi:MAG: hypothetical protein HYY40_09505 [Bacteroidetes bacterium]|nr:hypothetical protein [Bacteroidota bacterium]
MKLFCRILFIPFFIFLFQTAYAQDLGYMTIKGTVVLHGKTLPGVTAVLYKNGTKITTEITQNNGKFTFKELPLTVKDDEYIIELSKYGHVTLRHYVSARVPPDYGVHYPTYIPTIELFEMVPGLDKDLTSILEKPVSRFSYNPERRDFYDDKAYFNSIRARVEALFAILRAEADERYKLIADYRKKKMEEEKKKAETEAKYKEAIAKGDAHFKQEDYANAKAYYLQAHAVKPDETYALEKIGEIDRLLAASITEEQKKRDEAMKSELERQAREEEARTLEAGTNKKIKTEDEKKLTGISPGTTELADKEKLARLAEMRKAAEAKSAEDLMKKDTETKNIAGTNAMKSRNAEIVSDTRRQIYSGQMRSLMVMAAENERLAKTESAQKNPSEKKIYKPTAATKFPKYEYIPRMVQTEKKEILVTVNTTVIYFPTRRDTLQKASYLWGAENYFKNRKEISKDDYLRELNRFSFGK